MMNAPAPIPPKNRSSAGCHPQTDCNSMALLRSEHQARRVVQFGDRHRRPVRGLKQLIQRPEFQRAELARTHAIRVLLANATPAFWQQSRSFHRHRVVLRHLVRARLIAVLASDAQVGSTFTTPCSSFEMAPAGHTFMQLGSAQCVHDVEMKKVLPRLRLNEDTCLLSGVSSERPFSSLHASTHRPHPEQRESAVRKPYLTSSAFEPELASLAAASFPETAATPRASAQAPAADAVSIALRVMFTLSPIRIPRFHRPKAEVLTLRPRTPCSSQEETPFRPRPRRARRACRCQPVRGCSRSANTPSLPHSEKTCRTTSRSRRRRGELDRGHLGVAVIGIAFECDQVANLEAVAHGVEDVHLGAIVGCRGLQSREPPRKRTARFRPRRA